METVTELLETLLIAPVTFASLPSGIIVNPPHQSAITNRSQPRRSTAAWCAGRSVA